MHVGKEEKMFYSKLHESCSWQREKDVDILSTNILVQPAFHSSQKSLSFVQPCVLFSVKISFFFVCRVPLHVESMPKTRRLSVRKFFDEFVKRKRGFVRNDEFQMQSKNGKMHSEEKIVCLGIMHKSAVLKICLFIHFGIEIW